jgi:arylformamidase
MTAFDWRTASPDEVDFQYSPSKHSLRPLADYLVEYHELSVPHNAESLRIEGQPLLVYIHGGYWQRLSAADSLFNAPDAIRHGVSLHAVEYTLAPHASLPEIINECLTDVARTIESLNPSRVVLAGCSAGAHLSAMCARDAVIAPKLDAVVLLSGIYDLRPLIVTPTNDPLHLDENSATAVSPQLLNASVLLQRALLAVGHHESDEFIRQNTEYAEHLSAVGTKTDCIVVPDRDHFNLPYDLLREGTEVGDWTLRILKGHSE